MKPPKGIDAELGVKKQKCPMVSPAPPGWDDQDPHFPGVPIARGVLHPWLYPVAPLGRRGKRREVTKLRVRMRAMPSATTGQAISLLKTREKRCTSYAVLTSVLPPCKMSFCHSGRSPSSSPRPRSQLKLYSPHGVAGFAAPALAWANCFSKRLLSFIHSICPSAKPTPTPSPQASCAS